MYAVGDGNKATAAALRARLMQGKQPSMVLGPNPESVQLSAIDSKGRAVPGAFGRAAVGAGAPEGGRKPKRASVQLQRFHMHTQDHSVIMVKAILIISYSHSSLMEHIRPKAMMLRG